MRLAVITNAFPPEALGGAGQIASDLVDAWRANGYEVRVWQSRAAWLKQGLLGRFVGHLWTERLLPEFTSELADYAPEVVITHNLTGVGLLSLGRWLNARKFPWIHVLHDVQLFEPSGQLLQEQVTLWQRAWSTYRQLFFGQPAFVISPTHWLLKAHQQRGWFIESATQVISNPAPEAQFSSVEAKSWFFIGRLTCDKGADFLEVLARAVPQETFVCIGEGEWRSRLETLPNVHCLGQLSRPAILEQLSSAKGLLVPSRVAENQPTVILEALSRGVPGLVSPHGGSPETLGKAGIVALLDVSAWREAMMKLSSQAASYQQVARTQYTQFAPEVIQEQWTKLLLAMAAEKQTP